MNNINTWAHQKKLPITKKRNEHENDAIVRLKSLFVTCLVQILQRCDRNFKHSLKS